ncbi:MAG: 50S ribosomal protein L21 [Terriglobales bacterium]
MYAVIRSGGKQYRVSPGDVLEVEKLPQAAGDAFEFADVLAVRDEQGGLRPGAGARVSATVVRQARDRKILVFHYKRKKQYKKLQGHRQATTQVRIGEIQL